MPDTSTVAKPQDNATFVLRILETTDVHGNLLPYDYYTNQPVSSYGLARTASLIQTARQGCANTLLFDNGDYLQGTPISDLTAMDPTTPADQHPAILAMNALKYDAASIGNHEFNFGLDRLQAVLKGAEFPVTCANLMHHPAQTNDATAPLFPPFLLLDRHLQDDAGNLAPIRIGVLGLAPPQITTWDHYHLQDSVQSLDMIATAHQRVPEMRAMGADIVIVLAHTGIDTGPAEPMMENAAVHLGAVPGIDAILAGHTHEVFPSDEYTKTDQIEPEKGTLNGTPTVMAGARGSHLGLLDLHLTHDAKGRWSVTNARPRVAPINAATPTDPVLSRLLTPIHETTLQLTSRPLGHTAQPLHSYLSLVGWDPATALVMQAQTKAVASLLRGTPDEGTPILSASAPFKSGGRAGPAYYTDIPPGPLHLRHAADLYSFPNLLCALRLTGAEICDWLERAAIAFHQITPGRSNQLLVDPEIPGHHFDCIDGLTYKIDLSAPPRYALSGEIRNETATRIRDVRYQGRPLDPAQPFILATNNYRAFGGGPFQPVHPDQLALTANCLLRDKVADYIRSLDEMPNQQGDPAPPIWQFCTMPGTEVLFDTGPGLRAYPDEIAAIGARDLGDIKSGFMRLGLPL